MIVSWFIDFSSQITKTPSCRPQEFGSLMKVTVFVWQFEVLIDDELVVRSRMRQICSRPQWGGCTSDVNRLFCWVIYYDIVWLRQRKVGQCPEEFRTFCKERLLFWVLSFVFSCALGWRRDNRSKRLSEYDDIAFEGCSLCDLPSYKCFSCRQKWTLKSWLMLKNFLLILVADEGIERGRRDEIARWFELRVSEIFLS